MLLKPIADRLKTEVPAFRNNVTGTAGFAAAQEGLKSVPAGFVLPLMDKAGRNDLACGGVSQSVTERFGVVLVVSNMRDAQGGAAHDDLQTLRRAVLDALLGWQPSAEYNPVEYSGGRMLALNGADLWWQLEFTTAYFERKV